MLMLQTTLHLVEKLIIDHKFFDSESNELWQKALNKFDTTLAAKFAAMMYRNHHPFAIYILSGSIDHQISLCF